MATIIKCDKCKENKQFMLSVKIKEYAGKNFVQYDIKWMCADCIMPMLIKLKSDYKP